MTMLSSAQTASFTDDGFAIVPSVLTDADCDHLSNQQVWIVEGVMEITVGAAQWRLGAGDCLAMRLDQPITFHNPAANAARYLVALVSQPHKTPRRTE